MAINRTTQGVAYGLSDALLEVFPQPIVSTRDPQAGDKAQLGTVWVNKSTNDFFVLTSVVANSATWSSPSNGSGIFSSLEATTGDITADLGNIVATVGNVTAGGVMTADGNITSNSGNIIAAAGEFNATAGGITVATDITTTTGNVVVTLGNIGVDAGNITVSAGDITAVGGNIVAAAGVVNGVQVEATGDLGGVVSVTSLTNVTNTTQGAGDLTIKSTTGNPGDNTGFIKIYVGSTTAYVPYFTNIAP